jgi:hypothetical protein
LQQRWLITIEDEIEKLIKKAEFRGLPLDTIKKEIIRPILYAEIPLVPEKYKDFIYVDSYSIYYFHLKNKSLKNKIIFFFKKHHILKELEEDQRKRDARKEELLNLSIKELIQLAKKYNLDLNNIKNAVAYRIQIILECLDDPYIYPGKACG